MIKLLFFYFYFFFVEYTYFGLYVFKKNRQN